MEIISYPKIDLNVILNCSKSYCNSYSFKFWNIIKTNVVSLLPTNKWLILNHLGLR